MERVVGVGGGQGWEGAASGLTRTRTPGAMRHTGGGARRNESGEAREARQAVPEKETVETRTF